MVCRWAELNVDPALFSKELMANASSMVEDTEVIVTYSAAFPV